MEAITVKDEAMWGATADEEDFLRLPGLFRRWELPEVVEVGVDYRFEEAGATEDGTPLLAVYLRKRSLVQHEET